MYPNFYNNVATYMSKYDSKRHHQARQERQNMIISKLVPLSLKDGEISSLKPTAALST